MPENPTIEFSKLEVYSKQTPPPVRSGFVVQSRSAPDRSSPKLNTLLLGVIAVSLACSLDQENWIDSSLLEGRAPPQTPDQVVVDDLLKLGN
jgi:hypothetical protein